MHVVVGVTGLVFLSRETADHRGSYQASDRFPGGVGVSLASVFVNLTLFGPVVEASRPESLVKYDEPGKL
jgi:hypothetical protein